MGDISAKGAKAAKGFFVDRDFERDQRRFDENLASGVVLPRSDAPTKIPLAALAALAALALESDAHAPSCPSGRIRDVDA